MLNLTKQELLAELARIEGEEAKALEIAEAQVLRLEAMLIKARARVVELGGAKQAQVSVRASSSSNNIINELRAFVAKHGRRPSINDFKSGGLLEHLYKLEDSKWASEGLSPAQIANKYYQRAQSLLSHLK